MHWLFYNYPSKYPVERRIWVKIRILHETDKAILVYCKGKKIWLAKSRVYKIRLRKGDFEVCVRESVLDND